MVLFQRCGVGEGRGAGARIDTRWPASSGQPTYRGRATCVHGPGRCERLADRPGSSSVPGCGASSRGVRGSLAGCISEGKKTLCRVTTRWRNLWLLSNLGRGLRSQAALFLRLGVPGLDVGRQAAFGLPLSRLPASDLPLTFRMLAEALVVTPWLVCASAAFAQADPRARSAPSGPTVVFFRSVEVAHGRFGLPREKLGEDVSPSSSGAIKTQTRHFFASLSANRQQDKERDGFRNALQVETQRSTTWPVVLSRCSKMAPIICAAPSRP
jgi:hypothetical protein